MTADPVGWLLIEPGWRVNDRAGEEVAHVAEVLGDSELDIFDGLAITTGIASRPRYVPADQVMQIVEGEVTLALDRPGVDALAEYRR